MIELSDVYKRFRAPVLEGIDLTIPRGGVWGLIGPPACGKSLLLKLLCGLEQPDAGGVRVAGDDVARAHEAKLRQVRGRIGMLFQNNALFDFMSVVDNVAFPLLRAGVEPDEAEARAAARLRAVGLAGSERKAPSELSGGMKKRVGVARASVGQPEILLYDEPTAGLDPVTTSKIYELLAADQAESGATVIAVSSDVEGLRRFAPDLALLAKGRLRYTGPEAEIDGAEDALVRQFVRGELDGPL
ncbi:MAG: ABC transporter ATP-binding protein [Proteobacteria bacterium]|nr:MAG: ABC transporter ATP-binding protein [Pseudomonadota bacterium]PIE17969.1 MAG: ABC transporter ATP-binding protein [Pseudomonadota bacterium]